MGKEHSILSYIYFSIAVLYTFIASVIITTLYFYSVPSAQFACINPMTLGAKGDGISDDTASIQSAVDQANSTTSPVCIPNGTYIVRGIRMKSNTTIYGESKESTILKIADNANLHAFYHSYTEPVISNIVIKDLQIDGNKTHNTVGSAISIAGFNVEVSNTYIHDSAHACVDIGRPSDGGQIKIINNRCHNPALPGNFWGAFAITGGDGGFMANNTATTDDGYMAYGLDIEPNPGWTVKNVEISNNVVEGGSIYATGSGTGLTELNSERRVSENITIKNNVVKAHRLPVAGSAAGAPPALRIIGLAGKVIISDNTLEGPTHTSPVVELGYLTGAIFQKNTVKQNVTNQNQYYWGVAILVKGSQSVTVSDNRIESLSGRTSGAGIKEVLGETTLPSKFNIYRDNIFRDIGRPYDTLDTTSEVSPLVVPAISHPPTTSPF